jgi:hypothetical protein
VSVEGVVDRIEKLLRGIDKKVKDSQGSEEAKKKEDEA